MLAVAAILALALLPVGAFLALLIAWVALTFASLIAGLGALKLSRGAFVAAPFLLAALPLIFIRSGDPLGGFSIGPWELTVSGQGLREFATIALKSWLSVQVALLLTFTTPFHDLVDALRRLRLPLVMVGIISFMYRYLAVLGEEGSRMLRARAARSAVVGSGGGGSLAWRARTTGGMVGALFLRSYERSERIYAAMQARGFEGTLRHLHGRGMSGSEWLVGLALAASFVVFELAAQLWLPR